MKGGGEVVLPSIASVSLSCSMNRLCVSTRIITNLVRMRDIVQPVAWAVVKGALRNG